MSVSLHVVPASSHAKSDTEASSSANSIRKDCVPANTGEEILKQTEITDQSSVKSLKNRVCSCCEDKTLALLVVSAVFSLVVGVAFCLGAIYDKEIEDIFHL